MVVALVVVLIVTVAVAVIVVIGSWSFCCNSEGMMVLMAPSNDESMAMGMLGDSRSQKKR